MESVREGGGLPLNLDDIGENDGNEGLEDREWPLTSAEERRGSEREPLLAERERDGVVGRGRREPKLGVVGRLLPMEGVVGLGSKDGVEDLQLGREGVLHRPWDGVIGRGKRHGVELLLVVNKGVELLIVKREGVELRLPSGVLARSMPLRLATGVTLLSGKLILLAGLVDPESTLMPLSFLHTSLSLLLLSNFGSSMLFLRALTGILDDEEDEREVRLSSPNSYWVARLEIFSHSDSTSSGCMRFVVDDEVNRSKDPSSVPMMSRQAIFFALFLKFISSSWLGS